MIKVNFSRNWFRAIAVVVTSVLLSLISRAETEGNGAYEATIVRGEFGVPYIIADSLPDAAFGDGYAQAEDRLNLLMLNVLTATGTRAGQLGPSQVGRDYMARIAGARRTAYARWNDLPKPVRQVYEGFAAGVNHYMENSTQPLPKVARRLEPQEIATILLFGGLYRQMAQAQKDLLGQGGDPIAGEGSNGAVLAPSRSSSGNSLMLSDLHTPWGGPNKWYEKHYLTPEVEAHGFCSTGLPLFLFCATDRIAWTITRNPGDRGDCFVLKTNPVNPQQYWFDGAYRDLELIEESIEVKGGETVVRWVASTVHGPVMKRGKGKLFSAGMSMYNEVGALEQLYNALVSNNLGDFKQATAQRHMDGGNVFYTDIKGNTFYSWWSRLMERSEQYDWLNAVDGSKRDSLYGGILAFDKMPQSENDSGSYYQASNTADWTVGDGAWGLNKDDFPNWLLTSPERAFFPSRSQRTVDLITGRPKHRLKDLLSWSLDTHIVAAEWVFPLIDRSYLEHGNGGEKSVDRAMTALQQWQSDPRATKESQGYSVYREWLVALAGITSKAAGGSLLNEVADVRNTLPMLPDNPEKVPQKEVKQAHEALVQAVASLVKLYGTPTPKWGDINVIQLADGMRFPGGAADSVSQGMWQISHAKKRSKDGKWLGSAGSDAMMMAEMSDPPQVYTMVPYGQSDDPKSPRFANQTERYTNGQYKRAWFTRKEILAHGKDPVTISLKKR
jgi:acyl-homoserine-lactone acylase